MSRDSPKCYLKKDTGPPVPDVNKSEDATLAEQRHFQVLAKNPVAVGRLGR